MRRKERYPGITYSGYLASEDRPKSALTRLISFTSKERPNKNITKKKDMYLRLLDISG